MSSAPHNDRLDRPARPSPPLDQILQSAAKGMAIAGGVVGGLLGRALSSREAQPVRSLLGRVLGLNQRPLRPIPAGFGPGHADAEALLLGRTKDEVFRAFGEPPAATVDGVAALDPARPAFWQAGVWYYPTDEDRKAALAVHFDRGLVSRVETIPTAMPG